VSGGEGSAPGPPPETEESGSLPALVLGAVVGVVAFAALLAAGLLLYQRLYGDSGLALIVILMVFGGLGAYLAWLLGVIVYSRLRQPVEGDDA
jgi:hypothetical protein